MFMARESPPTHSKYLPSYTLFTVGLKKDIKNKYEQRNELRASMVSYITKG